MPAGKRTRKKGKVRLELGERASYRFAILSTRQVGQLSSVYLHRFGLTGNTWRVLSIIGYYGPMSATDVCRLGSLEAGKVTRAVDILRKKRLVLRRQNAKDRRKVVLSLSVRGRQVYDEIERLRYAQERAIMKALEPDELDSLYSILDKLEARADEIFVPVDRGKGARAADGDTG